MNPTIRVTSRRRWAIVAVAAMIAVGLSSCLSAPIAGTPYLVGTIDVTQVGYQQSEYFLSGKANAYRPTAPLTGDGAWQVERDTSTPPADFTTRIVVMRPQDPAAFNGTVVVEWLNVTAGADLPNDWVMAHNELIRSGAAWVGVSAQSVGINQLKGCCGTRYQSLVHPGDSYSYDIFNTAVRDLRAYRVFGDQVPQRYIATGESQSASRLVTYVNAVHPLERLFDGFMIHSRGVAGSALSQAPRPAVSAPSPTLIRNDISEPVFVVQAEGDVISSNAAVRQPDTPKFRAWELAGTSHADAYLVGVGFGDLGDGSGAVAMFDRMRNPGPPLGGCTSPTNAGGHHWAFQAAFRALDLWVRTGTGPPTAVPLRVASTSPLVLKRDAYGNALDGVRTPHVDAPVATLTGINSGTGFCRLFGSTAPLTDEQLTARYGTRAAFLAEWSAAIDAAVAGGFVLDDDAADLAAAAEASTVLAG